MNQSPWSLPKNYIRFGHDWLHLGPNRSTLYGRYTGVGADRRLERQDGRQHGKWTFARAPSSARERYFVLSLRSSLRPGLSTQSGGGLQIGARGRIAPEQGEDVAAEDIEVWFVRCQPNRLREVLERGLGGARFFETHLAAILPRLPQTGAQAKRFIQQRQPPASLPRRRQPDGLVENRGGIRDRRPALSPDKIEIRRRDQAQACYAWRAVERPTAQKQLARQWQACEEKRQRQNHPAPLASP